MFEFVFTQMSLILLWFSQLKTLIGMKKIERTRKKLNEVILIMILFLQIGRTERQTSCSGRLTIACMEKCMGFSKRLNINGNTKNYKQRNSWNFQNSWNNRRKSCIFKYLKTALTQVKQSKSYYCVAISNRVEYMKYLGYEWALSLAFDKIW